MDFLLAVITMPGYFAGEADYLDALLEAGLEKLHLRKPGADEYQMAALLERLAPRWAAQLVLHGSRELAGCYRIPQVHGSVRLVSGRGRSGGGAFLTGAADGEDGHWGQCGQAVGGAGMRSHTGTVISTSVHSWEEFKQLPSGLAYSFISPLFDSISKPGYGAGKNLLQRPAGDLPCPAVGLGGIGAETIGEMIRQGWKGAAVLGWIWEDPQAAVRRYEQLKKMIDEQPTIH
jgi:thiamine monophosphate synthase